MKSDIKLLVINNFYKNPNHPLSQKIMGKIFSLKVRGYQKVYGYGNLPFDKDDLFATHLIACEEIDGELYPFTGYKSVPYSLCKDYNLSFSFKDMIEQAGSESCRREFANLLEKAKQEGDDLTYDTTWAMDPEIAPEKKHLKVLTRDLTTAFLYFHHASQNIRYWLTFGMVGVKTDRFFLRMGAKPISDDPIINHPTIQYTFEEKGDPEVKAMAIACDTKNDYSPYTYSIVEKYQDLWDQRIEIN